MFEEEGTARTKLLSYLGFTMPVECSDKYSDLDNLGKGLENTLSLDTRSSVEVDVSTYSIDNGEEFFNNPQISEDSSAYEEKSVPNGEKAEKEPEEPSRSYDPSFDDSIQHALVVGDYKGAVLQCIAADRMADALVIAHAGGSSLWESTRDQYLKNNLAPYLKVVSALVRNDLMALINARPLNSWKETLALLCTVTVRPRTARYVPAWQLIGMRTSRYWAVPLKSAVGGRFRLSAIDFGCRRSNEGEIDYRQSIEEEKGRKKKRKRRKKKKRRSTSHRPRLRAACAPSPPAGRSRAIATCGRLLSPCGETSEILICYYLILLHSLSERDAPISLPYQSSASHTESLYGADQSGYGVLDYSHNYYEDNNLSQPLPQLHQNVADTSRAEGFHQAPGSAYGGNQLVQQKPQVPDFSNQRLFHPSQPSQNFIPSHTSQISQLSEMLNAISSPAWLLSYIRSVFLGHVIRMLFIVYLSCFSFFQGAANPLYQHGPPISAPQDVGASQPASITVQRFSQPISTSTAPRGFTPVYNPNFAQRPSISPVHPLSPTKSSETQPVGVPPAPPSTVQTVDTSNVPGNASSP
ncbi:hypothetical protein BHE74_00015575 [Ensete ventricosum]|nr:hypothetical protein BHE74_00015575 [Ensete ventricosum]